MKILTGFLLLFLVFPLPGISREGGGQSGSTSWEMVLEVSISGGMEPFGKVVDVEVMGDRLLALDQLSRSVSVFSLDGEHRSTFGREGDGPGEFSAAVSALSRPSPDGSLLVVDLGNGRLTEFDPSDHPTRTWSLSFLDGTVTKWGSLGTGVLLRQIQPSGVAMVRAKSLEQGGVTRPALQFLSLKDGSEDWETVMEFDTPPAMERAESGRMRMTFFPSVPIWAAIGDGRLAVGTSDAYRFTIIDQDGDSISQVGREVGRRGLSAREKRQILEDWTDQASRERDLPSNVMRALLKGMVVADSLPVVVDIVADDDGSMLVRRGLGLMDAWTPDGRSPLEDASGDPGWDYFDASGNFLGVVVGPGAFELLRFRDGRVYGIGRDEYDVTSVQVYSLRRR